MFCSLHAYLHRGSFIFSYQNGSLLMVILIWKLFVLWMNVFAGWRVWAEKTKSNKNSSGGVCEYLIMSVLYKHNDIYMDSSFVTFDIENFKGWLIFCNITVVKSFNVYDFCRL